jgi:signal transduction histidine kinase
VHFCWTESPVDVALRQLWALPYDLDALGSGSSKEETEQLDQVREAYKRYSDAAARFAELMKSGNKAAAQNWLSEKAYPLGDRAVQLTNQLLLTAQTNTKSANSRAAVAYRTAQFVIIGFAAGSVLLALGLGYVISWSLIEPVSKIGARLRQLATGDFTQRVHIVNGDELSMLASNLNRTSEELARLYSEIEDKGRALELASQHKSQFLANMSHELRTPLNAVLGFTEMLTDGLYGELPARAADALERIQANGRHLLGLINDVLDLSKIEAGQLTLSLGTYSMPQVVQSAVASTEPLARAKGLALTTSFAEGLPSGFGDERRLTQVLINLVGNSIKFSDTGSVEVVVKAADGVFDVAVSDTGPGIAPEDQAKIFEEFQQVDNSITRKKGGTGLGLAIAKCLIEMHGGTIGVESVLGHGSTFRIKLPVRATEHAEAA